MALSPMMQFYKKLKEQYTDSLLFFRLGDFYEMFFEDAKTASRELDLTLTGRDCGLTERAPMCGVPFHAVDGYISKLIARGYKVAICEQLSDPKTSKGMVERDVVRVITPGTVIEDNILQENRNNYLACIATDGKKYATAWVDVSTGEFNVSESDFKTFDSIEELLFSINPSEIICNDIISEGARNLNSIKLGKLPKFQKYFDWAFDEENAENIIKTHFDITTLQKFEFGTRKLAICVCGALLNYLKETQKCSLIHINTINIVQSNKFLVMDNNSRKSLEICESNKDGSKKATLLWVLDKTKTSMGARNIRKWLDQPLRDSKMINDRLCGVEEFIENTKLRSNMGEVLSNIKDIERLTSKLAYGNVGPRDLLALKQSLQTLPDIKALLSVANSSILKAINNSIYELPDILALLENAISDDAPAVMKDGGYIKKGYNATLDDYNNAKSNGKQWLANLEAQEKEETQIKTLKIGYNKVFGYYIEISKGSVDKVPFRYQRKQTLTTGERYITPELKDIEEKLLGAVEKAVALESKLFEEIKLQILKYIPMLQTTSQAISACDSLLSFARVSIENNYCKPQIDNSIEKIEIIDGRHPVVESLLTNSNFVPNDTTLDTSNNRTMIITGPNMAGKSTYMRQVALITLMAHIGCYVPAKSASISLTDRIFTRIGASDDLAYGQSTFMVEMVEVATILQNATTSSLLILDEIGRGTSTFDGLSIAQAVLEDISARLRCKTLFSTHYHELTELEGIVEGVKNYKIIATEKNKNIVFLHKIMKGGTNRSYGIEVAKLAGLPSTVISRAKSISKILETSPMTTCQSVDMPIFDMIENSEDKNDKLIDELQTIDINNLTPMQAFIKLQELINLSQQGE